MSDPAATDGAAAPGALDSATAGDEDRININLKTIDNTMHPIQISLAWSVGRFKEEIATKIGIAADLQRLLFRGRLLMDTQTLSEFKLEENYCVHLIQKVPPPPEEESDAVDADADTADASTDSVGAGTLHTRRNLARRVLETTNRSTDGQNWMGRVLRAGSAARPALQRRTRLLQTPLTRSAGPRLTGYRSSNGTTTRYYRSGPSRIASRSAVLRTQPRPESLEHMCQSVYTLNTLFSAMQSTRRLGLSVPEISFDGARDAQPTVPATPASEESKVAEDLSNAEEKKFYVGQWLDVKDTVNQWLEATVMDMNETSLCVKIALVNSPVVSPPSSIAIPTNI